MDGGINERTCAQALKAGAEVLVAGSFLFGSDDMRKTLQITQAAAI